MAKKPTKLNDDDLSSILRTKSENALTLWTGPLSLERIKADNYYRGEPFGDEKPNKSKFVSRDVAEGIDSTMPNLMRIFAGGDKVVEFVSNDIAHAEFAKEATAAVNYVFNQQNCGFNNQFIWQKAALMYKVGIIKSYWEEETEQHMESYNGLTQQQFDILKSQEDVTIIDYAEYEDTQMQEVINQQNQQNAMQMPGGALVMPPQAPHLFDVDVRVSKHTGKVRVVPVPSEEFGIEPTATESTGKVYVAQRTLITRSELVEMGYDRKIIDKLPGYTNEITNNIERVERYSPEFSPPIQDTTIDKSMEKVEIIEHYILVDYDGDGIAEYRKILTSGNNEKILSNEEVNDHPFSTLCPIPMPFRFFGLSLADLLMDIQLWKSTVIRQTMNNIYSANNQRVAVNQNVNLDDMLNNTAGGVVRTSNPQTDIMPIPVPNILGNSMQLMEYIESVKENRTGITKYNQGLVTDTLNKTAHGADLLQNNGLLRVEMIARIFAETGYRQLFQKILTLLIENQKEPMPIMVNGSTQYVNPQNWNKNYNVVIHVGLGNNDNDAMASAYASMLTLDEKIMEAQGGSEGPLLNLQNVYRKLIKLAENSGIKNPELYYSDPSKYQAPPPKPQPIDPMIQASLETEKMRASEKARETEMKLELDKQKHIDTTKFDMYKVEMNYKLEQEKLDLQAKELELKYNQSSLVMGAPNTTYNPILPDVSLKDIHISVNPVWAQQNPDIMAIRGAARPVAAPEEAAEGQNVQDSPQEDAMEGQGAAGHNPTPPADMPMDHMGSPNNQ